MAQKQEERDWSEIIAEVRSKAQSEVKELVGEIRPRVQELVKKVRNANFHEEAEELLSKLRQLADEFSSSEASPNKSAKKPTTSQAKSPPLYRDAEGKEWYRAPKGWTDAQKKKYRTR